MAKTKNVYVCQNCGMQSGRWVGRCPACESWNSYVEESVNVKPKAPRSGVLLDDRPVQLHELKVKDEDRLAIGMSELDRVLGGGLVAGSVTLLGGDPGIGKSTLMLQAMAGLVAQGKKVLYVSGEESTQQTRMRAERLGASDCKGLFIVNQVDLNTIQQHIENLKPDVAVLDSIQVVYHPDVPSSPGSVTQVRECAAVLTQLAKSLGMALFIIGHVTKDGAIAGPRVLEHIVDTVLYFEGERYTTYRVIRSMKNRFGSTNELGVFEMTGQGLMEVENPSEIFLAERPQRTSGSVVVPILEGSRPFLVEVQGLVSRSTFGVVRQKAQGFDANRLALLTAVLEKRLDLNIQDKDIFVNIVGGVKVADPAADLGVAVAVASAFLDRVIPQDIVFLGEVGLSAEVRSVVQLPLRLSESSKLGFKRAVVPKYNLAKRKTFDGADIELIPVTTVREALDICSGTL